MGAVIEFKKPQTELERIAAMPITKGMAFEQRGRIYEARHLLREQEKFEAFKAAIPGYLASVGMVAVPKAEWEARCEN